MLKFSGRGFDICRNRVRSFDCLLEATTKLRRGLISEILVLPGCLRKRRARAALDLATVRRQSGSHYLNGGNHFDIRKIALGQS